MNDIQSPFATASITLDDKYYREYYGQWLRHVSKWRRLCIPLALSIFVFGVIAMVLSHRAIPLTAGLFFAGIVLLYDHFSSRRKWLSERLSSKTQGGKLNITFTDDVIFMQVPYSEGTVKWEGIEFVRLTPLGVFLSPQKGASWYIPVASIQPPTAISTIVSKCG